MSRIVGLALLVGFGLALASAPPGAATVSVERKTLSSAKGVRIETEAGRLQVRENRSNPSSRMISVEFLRLKSTATNPRAPLFFLQGGPGSRGVSTHPNFLEAWVPFLALSDVVLIDQRGTNDSLLVWDWDGPLPLGFFLSADSARAHELEANRRAATAIRARGVDLAGYTTVESAADLDELRAALGVERMSLLAFSYGTHLACATMRRYGPRIENAVLVGVEGPDQTYKLPLTMDAQLRKLSLLAATDSALALRSPDLVELYDRAIARLAREPMTIVVPAPSDVPGASAADSVRLRVGPFGLQFVMRVDVGDATDLVVFPRLLSSVARGDPSVLAWFVRKRAGVVLGVHGMNAAMDAASGATPGRLALIRDQARTSRFADVVNFPFPEIASLWPVPDLGDEFRAPLVSPVRTLIVSGSLDFNTPPAQGEELRWGLANGTHLIVENAGHEQTYFQNETAVPVVLDFLRGQDVRDRKVTYPPLRFVPLEGSDPRVSHTAAAAPAAAPR